MPGQAMAHPELQPRPGPGYQYKTDRRALRRQQSGADLSSYYSVEDLRGKLRRRDGFGAKPRRPSSAKAIGVEHSDEFVAMKSAKSLSRPGSAAPGAQRPGARISSARAAAGDRWDAGRGDRRAGGETRYRGCLGCEEQLRCDRHAHRWQRYVVTKGGEFTRSSAR